MGMNRALGAPAAMGVIVAVVLSGCAAPAQDPRDLMVTNLVDRPIEFHVLFFNGDGQAPPGGPDKLPDQGQATLDSGKSRTLTTADVRLATPPYSVDVWAWTDSQSDEPWQRAAFAVEPGSGSVLYLWTEPDGWHCGTGGMSTPRADLVPCPGAAPPF